MRVHDLRVQDGTGLPWECSRDVSAENATDWCKVSCVLWLPVPTVQRAVAMHGTAADCKVVVRTSVVR